MSIKNFIPEIWDAGIFREYDKAFIFRSLVNRKYEGEISAYGDKVHITEFASPDISDYDPDSTSDLTYQKAATAQQTLVIDQAKSWALQIDDMDRVQALPGAFEEQARKAGVKLADTVDQDLAGLYSQAGLSIGSTAAGSTSIGSTGIQFINSGNILELVSLANKKFNVANVPTEGRWLAAPPWFFDKFTLADINKNTDNSGVMRNGFVMRLLGFDLFMSNNINSDSTNYYNLLAGNNDAITFAEQLVETEALRDPGRFNDRLRGLLVYGRKVVHPNALMNIVAADTTEV